MHSGSLSISKSHRHTQKKRCLESASENKQVNLIKYFFKHFLREIQFLKEIVISQEIFPRYKRVNSLVSNTPFWGVRLSRVAMQLRKSLDDNILSGLLPDGLQTEI